MTLTLRKLFFIRACFGAAVCATSINLCYAQQSYRWSVAPYVGVHEAQLESLNREALRAPTVGYGTVDRPDLGSDEQGSGSELPFGYDNSLGPIDREANVGLEFEWIQNAKNSLIFGASTWEGVSTGITSGRLPVQGVWQNMIYERRAKLSYNEFYIGWKRNLWRSGETYRLYGRATLNEIFDIDYRDEHVFTIQGGELDDVKRILNVKGQTTGHLMFQFGFGGEYFLKKNISVGFETSVILSERPFQLNNHSEDNNFSVGDNMSIFPPVRPTEEGRPLGSIPGDTDPNQNWGAADDKVRAPEPQEMKLRLDGWKAAFRVTVYY